MRVSIIALSRAALAQNGQNKVAKMCVRYGADVNAQNVRRPLLALRAAVPH
jgi:hypothetical protein